MKSLGVLFVFAGLGIGSLIGCTTDPTTGAVTLTPVGQSLVKIGCTLDTLAPGAVATVGAITTITDPKVANDVALANQVDQLAHPAVVAACAEALPGSVPATVVVAPAP